MAGWTGGAKLPLETCFSYLLPIEEEGTIVVVDDFDALIELVDKTGELWALGKELETVSEVTDSDIERVVALGFGVYTSVDVTNMFDEVAKGVDVLPDTVDVLSDDVGTLVWSADGFLELTTDEVRYFHDVSKGNGFELPCWMWLL